MILFLPFSQFDGQEAQRLLGWIADLDRVRSQPRLVLLCDNGVPWHLLDEVMAPARRAFRSVQIEVSPKTIVGWPSGPNHLFGMAAEMALRWNEPFLWMEPDCVPMRRGWLEEIFYEYARCQKPFLGALVPCKTPGLPPLHLNGNAVYPANAKEVLGDALSTTRAWDIAGAGVVVPLAAKSRLIQHFWGQPQLPPTFVQERTDQDPINAVTLDFVHAPTALFHRNKDGTLIGLLRKKFGLSKGAPPRQRVHVYSAEAESICVVQLGRYGDILNALPIALDLASADNGPVNFMVAEQFADLPKMCSYVRPVIYPGPFEDLHEALDLAHKKFDRVVSTQVYGKRYLAPAQTQSFIRESWRLAGYLERWNDLPLVIDERDLDQEEMFCSRVLGPKNGLPVVLFNGGGHSSPLPEASDLCMRLRAHLAGKAKVLDLGEIKAPRFADLLGLYERSDLLVTGDTGTLHLARACPIPTIEFFADKPSLWYGTGEPRGHECVLSMRYSQVQSRIPAILQAAEKGLILRQEATRFYMAYSEYDARDYETIRRQAVARETWLSLCKAHPEFRLMGLRDDNLPRTFRDGDKRRVPFIRDLIEAALGKARLWDYVCLFNADICFGPDLGSVLKGVAKRRLPFYSHRRDFGRLTVPLRTQKDVQAGQPYVGIDFFAFPKGWWLAHRHEMPDMLLGTEAWDMVLARIIQESGGLYRNDLVYHQIHPAFWAATDNRLKCLSQQHNRKLAFEFLKRRDLNPATYGLRR